MRTKGVTSMPFVTGLFLIDAPASALNNLGSIPGEREDHTSGVKVIKTREGTYPYVSAQAYRYWLRTTLEERVSNWRPAPIFREEKIAYTDANPLLYWDDDLFGYMRAPSSKESARAKREADTSRQGETETLETISRITPFRVSTLVSIAPVTITSDFGSMTRHEGYPVLFEHQFYRATLKGLFSLDLSSCGTFSYRKKSGYRNLDDVRISQAETITDIQHLEAKKSYRLPLEMRLERIRALFTGMSLLEGGAKLSIHYTDVAPAFIMFAVTKGGNHVFKHSVGANKMAQPEFKQAAFEEMLSINGDQLLSPLYIGWAKGYLDEERAKIETMLQASPHREHLLLTHPRTAFEHLITSFTDAEKSKIWLD
jgi:CRISPR-associated protein Cst2